MQHIVWATPGQICAGANNATYSMSFIWTKVPRNEHCNTLKGVYLDDYTEKRTMLRTKLKLDALTKNHGVTQRPKAPFLMYTRPYNPQSCYRGVSPGVASIISFRNFNPRHLMNSPKWGLGRFHPQKLWF